MSLGNKLMALGQWIEKRFPEKLTATEVNERYHALESGVEAVARRAASQDDVLQNLVARVVELEKKADTLNSDVNKAKIMLLTQRQTR
jgi:predicted  nucleic acid-binding Zn-ribbon protein